MNTINIKMKGLKVPFRKNNNAKQKLLLNHYYYSRSLNRRYEGVGSEIRRLDGVILLLGDTKFKNSVSSKNLKGKGLCIILEYK